LLYYVFYCSAITITEVVIERYTYIIHYIHWHWSFTWISLYLTFFTTRKFYLWFFRLNRKAQDSKNQK
jgi:hypothetical protein